MVIGIDNGNANTKTVHTTFTSGITKHDLKPPMADEVIKFDNKFYTLSSKRNTYTRDKTNNENCFILTLFAIAKEVLEDGKFEPEMDIDLAVGLPPEHYSLLKDKFGNYFKSFGRHIEYEYNERYFSININSVMVFPQAFSAVVSKPSNLKNYSRTYIVDIGGYTTDVLLLSNGKPDLSYCRSLELGIITMNNAIKGRVSTAYDIQIEEEHIYDVLTDRQTILSPEIQNFIKENASKHAENILDNLREQGIDLKASPAIFAGGGALLLRPYLESSKKTQLIEFLPDISANAVGYTILANGMLRKKNNI